jgi:hypothetical protein
VPTRQQLAQPARNRHDAARTETEHVTAAAARQQYTRLHLRHLRAPLPNRGWVRRCRQLCVELRSALERGMSRTCCCTASSLSARARSTAALHGSLPCGRARRAEPFPCLRTTLRDTCAIEDTHLPHSCNHPSRCLVAQLQLLCVGPPVQCAQGWWPVH